MNARCSFWRLDQIFFCDPVVLESICYRTRAKRLINKDNTTGGLRKIWTGNDCLLLKLAIDEQSIYRSYDQDKIINMSMIFRRIIYPWHADA